MDYVGMLCVLPTTWDDDDDLAQFYLPNKPEPLYACLETGSMGRWVDFHTGEPFNDPPLVRAMWKAYGACMGWGEDDDYYDSMEIPEDGWV